MCFVNDVIMKTSCFHNVLEKANRANANWVILIQKVLQVPEDALGPKRNSNQLLYAGRLDFKHICVLWCQCIMGVFHISYFNVFHFFVPTGPYVYFGEKILKLFGRSYSRTSLSLNPVTLDPPRLCSHHHRLHKFIISLVNFLFLHIQSDLYLNCCTKYVSFLKLRIFFRPLIVLHEYRDIMKIPEIWLHLTNDNDKWHEYQDRIWNVGFYTHPKCFAQISG